MNNSYPFLKPTYDEFNDMVNILFEKYDVKYKKLHENYKLVLKKCDKKRYISLMNHKRKLDIRYIKKIIKMFKPVIKDSDNIIFWHGSYSKCLNRWNSDIDINLLFKDNKKDYKMVEELICCAIYKILKFPGRDKIHTMMLYLPEISDKKYNIKSNKYSIKFKDGNVYKYNCRNNYETIYPKILNTSRVIKDFFNYLINGGYDKEYLYSYEGVFKKDKKRINKILKIKDNMLIFNEYQFYENIKKYEKSIEFDDLNNVNTVSDINIILKMTNMNYIYNMLLFLKEFIVLKRGKCFNLNINRVIKNKTLKKYISKDELNNLYNFIYKYMFFLDRVENIFIELKINFSSREKSNIDLKEFEKAYKNYYNCDFKKDYLVFNDFIKSVKGIIRRIMKYE